MFVASASYVKTRQEWAAQSSRRSAHAAAKRHAEANMVAVIMEADDSAVAYLLDAESGAVRRKTFRNVEWAN